MTWSMYARGPLFCRVLHCGRGYVGWQGVAGILFPWWETLPQDFAATGRLRDKNFFRFFLCLKELHEKFAIMKRRGCTNSQTLAWIRTLAGDGFFTGSSTFGQRRWQTVFVSGSCSTVVAQLQRSFRCSCRATAVLCAVLGIGGNRFCSRVVLPCCDGHDACNVISTKIQRDSFIFLQIYCDNCFALVGELSLPFEFGAFSEYPSIQKPCQQVSMQESVLFPPCSWYQAAPGFSTQAQTTHEETVVSWMNSIGSNEQVVAT